VTPEENEAIQRVSKPIQLVVHAAHMCASAYGAKDMTSRQSPCCFITACGLLT
jgi:hypothetical protein